MKSDKEDPKSAMPPALQATIQPEFQLLVPASHAHMFSEREKLTLVDLPDTRQSKPPATHCYYLGRQLCRRKWLQSKAV